jgi:hypothetical protein
LQFTFIPGGALLAGTLAVPSIALREKNIIGKNKGGREQNSRLDTKDPQIFFLRKWSISAIGSWW